MPPVDGSRFSWWLERVIVWLEVDLKPWRIDGYPDATEDINVLQFWHDKLTDYLEARAKVQARCRADPEFVKARDRALSNAEQTGMSLEELENQDAEGDW